MMETPFAQTIDRVGIKQTAKERFKAKYWTCVGVVFLMLLITGVCQTVVTLVGGAMGIPNDTAALESGIMPISGAGLTLYSVLSMLVALVTGTFAIEAAYFFLRVYRGEDVTVGDYVSNLFSNLGRKMGANLWLGFIMFLWIMLSMIPVFAISFAAVAGSEQTTAILTVLVVIALIALYVFVIIKGLSYSMMYYIVRDCPNVPVREAMKLSIRMTKGYKGQIFMFGLSFIGWFLLVGLTVGLLMLFYVGPYAATSAAGLYDDLKARAIASGAVSSAEFGA